MKIKKRPKIEDLKVGRIFFVPFPTGDRGVFGYVKYSASTRTNPNSLEMSMGDIYDYICKLDDWNEDIKQKNIKINDHIINAGYFHKTRYNINPMILTNYYTDIIHSVKEGFFKTDSEKYWYDADAENIVYPDDEKKYRVLRMAFAPYDQEYIEAIFSGKNIKYGDPIPGIDYEY